MAQANNKVLLEPAYVLHQRPYRDTSLLLEVFSLSYGRVGLVARGVKGKRNQRQALLQPFIPLQLSWSGRGELATLTDVEAGGAAHKLVGPVLLSSFYINELLTHLLHRHDPHPDLFEYYRYTFNQLDSLNQPQLLQRHLRLFEKQLLEEIGYGLMLEYELVQGDPIDANRSYYYHPGQGPMLAQGDDVNQTMLFKGDSLLVFAEENLDQPQHLKDARRLTRLVLDHYLGGKKLHSRKLLMDLQRTTEAAALSRRQD